MINSTAYYNDFWNEMRGKQAVTDNLYNNRESKTNAYHLPGESNKKYTAVLQKESAVRQLATVVNATRSDSRLWTFDCEGQAEWGWTVRRKRVRRKKDRSKTGNRKQPSGQPDGRTGCCSGYDIPETSEDITSAQFDVSDTRTLDQVVNWLMKMDYIPSFCTACYRAGRTGDRFMALCKSMQILNCCHPNALMTLKEYLEDYASPETKQIGLELIERELARIPNEKVRQITADHIHDIAEGQRDFRF